MFVRPWIVGLLGCLLVQTATAELQIYHAEAIDLPLQSQVSQSARNVSTKQRLPAQSRFAAYGREFAMSLQPNDRLIESLPASIVGDSTVYRGTLEGIPSSWVRLTVTKREVHGAVWDGTDLYTIAPAAQLAAHMITAPASLDGTLVFRLADASGGLPAEFCGSVTQSEKRGSSLVQYQAMLNELSELAALVPRQIEVAMLADAEFAQAGSDPQAAMLATVNVVDGIFTAQLGVSIIPTDFTISQSDFTQTAGPALLQQLVQYRASNPLVRSRGLAHLLTGKDLDGDTAGIAFVDALCEVEGVGVTEGWRNGGYAAFIMAHELGHNFGAPHDGDPARACASTASGYLMWPYVSPTTQFSACSLQQMQAAADAGSCVVAARYADVRIETPTQVQGYTEEVLELPIDVHSIGNIPAESFQVETELTYFQIESAIATGASCSVQPGGRITCDFASLQPGESGRILVRAKPNFIQATAARTQLSRRGNDRINTNDLSTTQINIANGSDLNVISQPGSIVGNVHDPITFWIEATANGPRPAANVTADMTFNDVVPVSITPSAGAGTCTATATAYSVQCDFGTLPVGATRRIEVTVSSDAVQANQGAYVTFAATNDAITENNSRYVPIQVRADRDVRVAPSGRDQYVLTNEPFIVQYEIVSAGRLASNPTVVTINEGPSTPLTFTTATVQGGSCLINGTSVTCNVPSIEPGGSRTVTLIAAPAGAGVYYTNITLTSTGDDVEFNNTGQVASWVRHAVDASIAPRVSTNLRPFTHKPFRLAAELRSYGLNAATNVSVTATLPAGYQVIAATLAGGHCTIASTALTCTLATLASDGDGIALSVDLMTTIAGDASVSLHVTVANDAVAFNNRTDWHIDAIEGPDARLEAGVPVSMYTGTSRTVSLFLRTGASQLFQSELELSVPANAVIESARADLAGCGAFNGPRQLRCTYWGGIPANASLRVDVVVRPITADDFVVTGVLRSADDVDSSNNRASVAVTVTRSIGDGAVSVGPAVTTTQGNMFAFPLISITAIESLEDARVSIEFGLVTIESVSAVGGACTVGTNAIECLLGSITRGDSRAIAITARAHTAGSFAGIVTLNATNESNSTNNTGEVRVSIQAVAPTPVPANPSASSGGGGGGSMSEFYVLLLLIIALARHQRSLISQVFACRTQFIKYDDAIFR